jgi:hypothetical protein
MRYDIIAIVAVLFLGIAIGIYARSYTGEVSAVPAQVVNLTCGRPIVNVPACPNATNTITNYIEDCQTSDIAQIAANLVKEKGYTDDYNCDEMSMELLRRYNNAGYEAEYCEGIYTGNGDNQGHAWVRVCSYVESTSGRLINADDFKKYYSKSWCRNG